MPTNGDARKEFQLAKKRFEAADRGRKQHEHRWNVAEAFLAGEHNVQWGQRSRELGRPPKEDPWKPRLVINKCLAYYRKELGRLVAATPQYDCAPGSHDLEDIVSALHCTLAIRHWDRALNLDMVDVAVCAAKITHSRAFVKIRWNPEARDDLGRKVGEIEVAPVLAWDMHIWPASATSLKYARYVFHTVDMTLDEAKERFGDKVEGLKPGQGRPAELGFFRKLMTRFGSAMGRDTATDDETITVTESWQWPSPTHPEGQWIIWSGDRLLQEPGPIPYEHRRIPFVDFIYVPIPGVYWGEGLMYPLAQINARYNRSASQIMEALNRIIGGDKWFLPTGCGIGKDQLTKDPNEIVGYNPLFDMAGREIRPWRAEAPQLSPAAFTYLRSQDADFDQQASQHEVTWGKSPANIESGVGVRALQEADTIPLGPTAKDAEAGWAEVYKQMLLLAQQYYVEDRILRWFGKSKELELMEGFSRRNIRPNVDVVVRAGTALPRSRGVMRQETVDLTLAGILNPDEARSILELENLMPFNDDRAIDVGAANRENSLMLAGEVCLVHSYDNHPVHVIQHDKFRKMPEFERQPEQTRRMFEMHVQGHKLVMATLMPPPEPAPAGRPQTREGVPA